MKKLRLLKPVFALCAMFSSVIPAVTGAEPAANRIVTVQEAETLLAKDKTIVVLDVRTPEEFKAGHIAGAVNVDFNGDSFDKELAKLDRNKTYLLHCASGGRSSQAEDQMTELKFQSVLHLKEGFNGWKKQGKPIEK